LGDIFDVAWKANLRNANLLEKLEQDQDRTETESSILNWILLIVLLVILIGVIVGLIWLTTIAWNRLFG
jgi:flagellar basal body-associated protein FliL